MGFLSDLVSSPGVIFGPLMLLAGVVAGGMSARATLRPSYRAAHRAVWWSLVPAAIGLMAAVFGGVRWTFLYGPAVSPWSQTWPVLGYTALFGAAVSVVPLAWAAALARRSGRPLGQAAADYDDRAAAGPGAAADPRPQSGSDK
jgi:hypothetical protein